MFQALRRIGKNAKLSDEDFFRLSLILRMSKYPSIIDRFFLLNYWSPALIENWEHRRNKLGPLDAAKTLYYGMLIAPRSANYPELEAVNLVTDCRVRLTEEGCRALVEAMELLVDFTSVNALESEIIFK